MPQIGSPIDPSEGLDDAFAGSIADVAHVRALLVASARRREAMTYSGLLDALGHRFTRPKMRAVCRTLDAIDEAGRAAGEPGLAVLVVREADGLPGQGWWTEGPPRREGYAGAWSGPQATGFVKELQARAFAYWPMSTDAGAPRPRGVRRPASSR